jgi:hypothetical protein
MHNRVRLHSVVCPCIKADVRVTAMPRITYDGSWRKDVYYVVTTRALGRYSGQVRHETPRFTRLTFEDFLEGFIFYF